MTKKRLKIIIPFLTITLIVYLTILLLTLPYYIEKLEHMPSIKISNSSLIDYQNLNALSPKKLGFENYHEIEFKSSKDPHIYLSGWYIPSEEPSDSCFILVHGWRSSRQSTLPFLEILKKYKITKNNNILMLDLRNAGKSSKFISDLGYKTSYDIYDAIRYLKEKNNIKNINIYSISMGSMATINMLNLNKEKIKNLGVNINKIILDSPLMNAKEAIKNTKAPWIFKNNFIYIPFFMLVNSRWNNFLDKLSFSILVHNIEIEKMLILQSKKDKVTTFPIFEQEINKIKELNKKIKIVTFDKGKHGALYNKNLEKYESEIEEFLK